LNGGKGIAPATNQTDLRTTLKREGMIVMKHGVAVWSLIIMIMCGLFISGSYAQETTDKELITKVDALINKGLAEWNVPGLAVAIVKDGKVVYIQGYGFGDLKKKKPITTDTLFSIASTTKSFTASAAALTVQNKVMEYDVPLIRYFPELKLYDPLATDRVTLRDLLVHRTGIPRQKFFSINPPAQRSEVRKSLAFFEPTADFRSMFQYCNETYTVAGDMIAEKNGTTWEKLISESFLVPLNMTNTYFSLSQIPKKEYIATPYIIRNDVPEILPYHNADILGPAGSIISTVKDMTQWLLFHMNKGNVNGKQLLPAQRIQQMQWPQIVVNEQVMFPELTYKSYGIGCFIDYYRGHKKVTFAGNLYGFSSTVAFLPNENIGIVVMANINDSFFHDVLTFSVFDMLLGVDTVDWDARYKDIQKKTDDYYASMMKNNPPPPTVTPQFELSAYCGTYSHEAYGTIVVKKLKQVLVAVLGGVECPLRSVGEGYFELHHPIEDSDIYIVFSANEQKTIVSVSTQVVPKTKEIVFQRKP